MDGSIMRSVAEYIVESKRRDRQSNGTGQYTPNYPETEFDTNGVERDWRGDERCDQDSTGQGGNNI